MTEYCVGCGALVDTNNQDWDDNAGGFFCDDYCRSEFYENVYGCAPFSIDSVMAMMDEVIGVLP